MRKSKKNRHFQFGGAAEGGKFQNFSLKFRAIFENHEKDQKKTDVFNLVGPLKTEKF